MDEPTQSPAEQTTSGKPRGRRTLGIAAVSVVAVAALAVTAAAVLPGLGEDDPDAASAPTSDAPEPSDAESGTAQAIREALEPVPLQRTEIADRLAQSFNGPLTGVPDEYRELVRGAADTCPGLPAPILAAQIEAESTWNPKAVSHAGAEGIAQFLPSTWELFGMDANGNGEADPFEPADAIYSSAAYDCDLKHRLRNVPGDNITNMLAGYHAGPGEVVKAGGIPPFPATGQYVLHILSISTRNAVNSIG